MSGRGPWVPRERIAEIIERELLRYEGVVNSRAGWAATSAPRGALDNMTSEIARASGLKEESVARRLSAIRTGKIGVNKRGETILQRFVAFDTVDTILTALGLVHLWHTELADIYEQLTEHTLELVNPHVHRRCIGCGCGMDDTTPDCDNCRKRHQWRRYQARRKAA